MRALAALTPVCPHVARSAGDGLSKPDPRAMTEQGTASRKLARGPLFIRADPREDRARQSGGTGPRRCSNRMETAGQELPAVSARGRGAAEVALAAVLFTFSDHATARRRR
jgi:hypothetical protein